MADKVKYHINDKGNPGICRAKKRCRFGDIESEHYETPDEARAAYESRMEGERLERERAEAAARKNPMGFLPGIHRSINNESDAFYRLTPAQDEEALNHLAEYYFAKEMKKHSKDPEDELAMVAAKAKLLGTSLGAQYKGWKHDPMHLLGDRTPGEVEAIDTSIPSPPASASVPDEFPDQGTVRRELRDAEMSRALITYANDSRAFLTNLSASEHNALAYWTGCGSMVSNSILHGFTNPWGIQGDTPANEEDDDDYFDNESYMRQIDAAIEKAPLTPGRVLYRGLSEGAVPDEVMEEYFEDAENRPRSMEWAREKFALGEEVTFDAPLSTSLNPKSASSFASAGVMLEIRARRAAPVGALSAWGMSEMEYLAPRTSSYRVVGVREGEVFSSQGFGGREVESTYLVVQLEQVLEREA